MGAADFATAAQTVALAQACQQSLIAYSTFIDPKYRANLMHRYIASRLEAAVQRGHGRIMVFAPPQHGKSEIVSRKFPAWLLGVRPDWPVIAASYGDDLVLLNGGAVRDTLRGAFHQLVFPNSQLTASSTAKDDFKLTEGGAYLGVTVRGGASGFPAKVFIIDDPFKDRAEADSKVEREARKNWYSSVVIPRLAEHSIVVVMHTRWHTDDLAGWLLAEHAHEEWEVINLPAEAEDDDILGRKLGDPLVPERFSAEGLRRKKLSVSPRDWLALFQQRPVAEGGGEFIEQWIQYYSDVRAGEGMNKLILVDPANGKRKDNDFTAMWVLGLNADGNYYVLDLVRDRLNLTERAKKLVQLHRRWRPTMPVRYERYGMQADIQHINTEMERLQYRFPIVEVAGAMKKEDRIRRLIPGFQQRKFYFPGALHYTRQDGQTVDLVREFIEEEYKSFPVSKHDDALDALSRLMEEGPEFELEWPNREDYFQPINVGFRPLDTEAGY